MNSLTAKIIAISIVVAGTGLVATTSAGAVNVIDQSCPDGATAKICDTKKDNIENNNFIQNLVNTLLYLLGAAAVIVIIIGGLTYTTANGDANRTKQAKNIIFYAVVGLVLAIMAWGIVNFVARAFS